MKILLSGYIEKALPKINILSTETNLVTEIAFKEEAYDLSLTWGLSIIRIW